MIARILRGKVEQFCRHYHGPLFHALLCDAPYHLYSIAERFGADDAAPARGDVYARSSRGFMGKSWDGGDVAMRPETWAGLARLLYPGAFLMVAAGTLNDDLISLAMRQAGLRKYHKAVYWAYGSGFPKATQVKAGDVWAGHRYGLQALKPAAETILIFQKPYEGRPVDNIVTTGAGALNVDKGRVATGERPLIERNHHGLTGNTWDGGLDGSLAGSRNIGMTDSGRWPANLILEHLPACNGVCAEGCPVKALGEQSGELKSGRIDTANQNISIWGSASNRQGIFDASEGTAARFFFQADWRLDQAEPVRYEAKASRGERDAGLEGFELVEKPRARPDSPDMTGKFPDHDHREIGRNPHPTVKPISLAKYLASLLLPPAEYSPRRILVPFAGVGSEMIGAMLAGWEEVIGVEMTAEYIPIARARLEWWGQWPGWGQTEPDKILEAEAAQLPMFAQPALFGGESD